MEIDKVSAEFLEAMHFPAFIARDGQIIMTNTAAKQRLLDRNMCIADLVCIGKAEYKAFKKGKLCLQLSVNGQLYDASVTSYEDYQLFTLESAYETPELQVLAKAAQALREPLSNAIIGLEQIISQDYEKKEYADSTAEINRSLHQMLRTIGNMSDVGLLNEHTHKKLYQDAIWIFDEILQKAANVAQKAKRIFTYTLPKHSAMCNIDAEQTERAVLNLVSNALKFSSPKSKVSAVLKVNKNTLSFTIENKSKELNSHIWVNFFNRFQHEPMIEDGRNGIGLGLSIARKVALIHNGTLLLEQLNNNTIRITMTFAIDTAAQSALPTLRSPIKLPILCANTINNTLTELSDALPSALFDNRF